MSWEVLISPRLAVTTYHTLDISFRSSFYHQPPFDQLTFPLTMSTAQFPVEFLEYQRFVDQQGLAQRRSLDAAEYFRTDSPSAPQQPDVANQGNMSQPDISMYRQAEKRDEYMNEKLRMMELRMMGTNQKQHEAIRLTMAALDDFQPSGQPKHLSNIVEDVMADQYRSERQYQLSHIRYQAEPECVVLAPSLTENILLSEPEGSDISIYSVTLRAGIHIQLRVPGNECD